MKQHLKIAYFAFSEEYGAKHAGFTHSYNITKAIAKEGINVDLFYSSKKIGIIKKEGKLIIHGVIMPKLEKITRPSSFLKSYYYIKKITKESNVIHERFHINPIDLLFIKNKKYIIEVNDPAIPLYSGIKGKIYTKLIKRKFKKCYSIITQTETLKNILKDYTKKQIDVIPNGVDTKNFRPKIKNNVRKEFKIKKNEKIIVFVGAFMQWHGVQDIPEIAINIPEAKFLIIGEGPLYSEIKEKSKTIKNIILTGAVDSQKIPQLLAAGDILIAPFNTTRFNKLEKYGFWWSPVKLFEYMAAGKPIISYDYTEVKNIVGEAGILAHKGDLKDFIRQIKILINNKKLMYKLGKTAVKISKKYDWSIRAKNTIAIYKK